MWRQEINGSTILREEDAHDSQQTPGILQNFIMRVRRKARKVPFLLLVMVLSLFFHEGHSVWSFNIPNQVYLFGSVRTNVICQTTDLSRTQENLCLNQYTNQVTSAGEGNRIAIAECKFQFQYRLWNCSIPASEKSKSLARIKDQDTREAAFTYAINAAGVVWALARACAEGNFSGECGCSKEIRPKSIKKDYLWGGCGDNIIYGTSFAKLFLNAEETDRVSEFQNKAKKDQSIDQKKLSEVHERSLMNMHNNDVGIRVVTQLSIIECKCHGVSGSCNLKTCWRQLSEFREIGNRLHDKYDAAVAAKIGRQEGRLMLLRKKVTRSYSKRQALENLQKDELVYIKPSPNFCYKDTKKGIPGTKGRKCIKDSPGTDGCQILCCDRGYSSKLVTVEKRCKCKFYWCCYVKCKTCSSKVMMHTCN